MGKISQETLHISVGFVAKRLRVLIMNKGGHIESCPVWHTSLAVAESAKIEAIQWRAMRIIEPELGYDAACSKHQLEKTSFRRENMSRKFFTAIRSTSHKLHHILSQPKSTRYSSVIHQNYPSRKLIPTGLRTLWYPMVYFITNHYILLTSFRFPFRYHKDRWRELMEGKKLGLHLTSNFVAVCIYICFICILFCMYFSVPPLGYLSYRCYLAETLPGLIASWLYIRSAKTLQGIGSKALVSATILVVVC